MILKSLPEKIWWDKSHLFYLDVKHLISIFFQFSLPFPRGRIPSISSLSHKTLSSIFYHITHKLEAGKLEAGIPYKLESWGGHIYQKFLPIEKFRKAGTAGKNKLFSLIRSA